MRFLIFSTSPLGALADGILATWLGIRSALWILLSTLTLSGTLLLTRARTGRQDLPGTIPAPGLDR